MPGIGEFAQRLSIRIDGPTGIEHHRRLESCLSRIKGRCTHAKIKSKAANINFFDLPFPEPASKPSSRFTICFNKSRIAVARFSHALAHDESRARGIQSIRKQRPRRTCNAVRRPQHLLHAVEPHRFKGLFSWMIGCEAFVISRMPIRRQNDKVKAVHEAVDGLYNRIALRHCQSASRQKVILHINHDQPAVGMNFQSFHSNGNSTRKPCIHAGKQTPPPLCF